MSSLFSLSTLSAWDCLSYTYTPRFNVSLALLSVVFHFLVLAPVLTSISPENIMLILYLLVFHSAYACPQLCIFICTTSSSMTYTSRTMIR